MSNPAEQPKKEKKALPVALILQGLFAVVNLGVVGGGAYLVYASTLGWHPPVITEKGLAKGRHPASVEKPAGEAAPAEGGGHGAAPAEGTAAEAGGEEGSGPLLHKLEKMTANLGGEPRRMIEIEVNLDMLNEESYEEVMDTPRIPKIRDRIVAILNEKSFSDLESLQGKLFLKDRIASEVNALLDKGVVKDVFFSKFVVQ